MFKSSPYEEIRNMLAHVNILCMARIMFVRGCCWTSFLSSIITSIIPVGQVR